MCSSTLRMGVKIKSLVYDLSSFSLWRPRRLGLFLGNRLIKIPVLFSKHLQTDGFYGGLIMQKFKTWVKIFFFVEKLKLCSTQEAGASKSQRSLKQSTQECTWNEWTEPARQAILIPCSYFGCFSTYLKPAFKISRYFFLTPNKVFRWSTYRT